MLAAIPYRRYRTTGKFSAGSNADVHSLDTILKDAFPLGRQPNKPHFPVTSRYRCPLSSLPFKNNCGAPLSLVQRTADPICHGEGKIRHLNGWMSLAAKLSDSFDNLGDAAAMRRMIVAQSAAIGVDGQSTIA